MIRRQMVGVMVAVVVGLPLSGCGQNPVGGTATAATTAQAETSKQKLPKPQQVFRNSKQFANLAIASTKTTGGQKVGIDLIPEDYDAIALGGNLAFPEGETTIDKGGPFVTLNFTRDAKSSGPAQLALTVKRDGKVVAEKTLKPGEDFTVELTGIKSKTDTIEWSVAEPAGGATQKDGVRLTMCGSKKGLVRYTLEIP